MVEKRKFIINLVHSLKLSPVNRSMRVINFILMEANENENSFW